MERLGRRDRERAIPDCERCRPHSRSGTEAETEMGVRCSERSRNAFAAHGCIRTRVLRKRRCVFVPLDAKTGGVYWSFQADAGIRSAPTVTAIKGQGSTRYAVYFVDVLTRVYALDAQTGKLLWKVKAGDHPRAKSTGSPIVYDGRIYVPVSSMETTTGAVLTYECCTFRGHVVALDANTGRRIWRTFVIQEEPQPRGKNKNGVTLWGPSGGAVWNAPTIDAKRKRLYVGTGNA